MCHQIIKQLHIGKNFLETSHIEFQIVNFLILFNQKKI